MRLTVKLNAEDWLFARKFAYVDGQNEPYLYQKNAFKKKNPNEPKKDGKVPYLIIDEVGIMINHINEKGRWMKWDWEDTKSIRVYGLMHPWKASIYQWILDADFYRERRKDKRYFRCMRWRYPKFNYHYEETYDTHYSLILEGSKAKGQICIPKSWVEENSDAFYLEKIEELSGKKIKYFNTDDEWATVRAKKNTQE